MRLAAIDIGTNSTRLLITELISRKDNYPLLNPVLRDMHITRLGKSLDKYGDISYENAGCTIEVLKKYLKTIKKHKVKKYMAAGTRVLRQAGNSAWFVNYIKSLLGLDISVISGQEEAGLSFNGAIRGIESAIRLKTNNELSGFIKFKPDNSDQNILVTDIGGGSTEFIYGSLGGGLSFSESIDIGSVNISERFLDDIVPDKSTIEIMNAFIRAKIKNIIEEIKFKENFSFMVGLAGTVSALASTDLKLAIYDRDKIHGHVLCLNKIKDIQEGFCSLELKKRKTITGLEPERADIIIGGTAILLQAMSMLNIDKIIVSESDILEGIIYSIF